MRKIKIVLPIFLSVVVLASGILGTDLLKQKGSRASTAPALLEERESPKEKYLRFLVAGEDQGGALCDVLILFSLNRETGEAWGLQLPRDTYAKYSQGSYRKLNGAASALGGMEALCRFLEDCLSLSLDGYVRLSPDALRRGVDALGGVEICLAREMDYEDPVQGLSIHLPAGNQTLDGAMAEQFVRYRSGYLRGDLDRMDAQKQFLAALYGTVREKLNPLSAMRLGMSLLGSVQTDLTLPDLTCLASFLFRTDACRIFLVTAPGEEATAKKSGASYYVLSAPAMDRLLAEHFGGVEGGFDPKGVFLNERYEEFIQIYRQNTESAPYALGQ